LTYTALSGFVDVLQVHDIKIFMYSGHKQLLTALLIFMEYSEILRTFDQQEL